MTTETIPTSAAPQLTDEAKAVLTSWPDPPEVKTDDDFALLPDGSFISLKPSDYRNPEKKTYPDAIPIIWESWLYGPSSEIATLALGDANVIAATGLKGNGKSETLALLTAKALADNMPVWSNMGVKFWLVREDESIQLCQSLPLDWGAVLMLSSELQNGALVIDELSYYASSRQSSSVRNRIINAAVNQVRKRTLDFYASVKFLRQIDINIREELDCHIGCEDVARSKKGQAADLDKGCYIKWLIRDISGWSGTPSQPGGADWDRLGDPIYTNEGAKRLFSARFTWPIYNSYEVVKVADAFRKVRLDLQETVISDKPDGSAVRGELQEVIELFTSQGEYRPDTDTFRQTVKSYGINLSDKALGKLLPDLGVSRKRTHGGNYYELPDNDAL